MAIPQKASIMLENSLFFSGLSAAPRTVQSSILLEHGRIVAIGSSVTASGDAEVVDCGGRPVTSALMDCPAHMIYAGNRSCEFEMRLEGASNADVTATGGGIVSTLRATRRPPVEQLEYLTEADTRAMAAAGTVAVLFKLPGGECLLGTTRDAAPALALSDETGELRPGLSAEWAVWNAPGPAELVNPIGFNPLHARYFKGKTV